MKKMLFNRNTPIAAVVFCAICAVTGIKAFSPAEFNPQPDPPVGFGLIGVTPASQYARFNVTNIAASDVNGIAGCQVALSFGDGQGNTQKSGPLTALLQGKSASLTLMQADVTNAAGALAPASRLETMPSVETAGACSLVSSLELVATATGQTSAYATHASGGINHNETLVRDTESQ